MTDYPSWPEMFRWLNVLKDRVETLPSISAEQVVTGTLDPSRIPPIPWSRVLKAGSSLGDLETRSAGDLSSGTLLGARMPALSGDISSLVGDVVTTLATVNASPGYFGSGTKIPILTVNGKGLVTNVVEQPIQTGALTRVNDTNVTATLTGTPLTALLKNVTITMGWTGTLGVARGGTGTGTAFTAGSVVFAGPSGVYAQDNANLFWDDTNDRLGIGTASPNFSLDVRGQATFTGFQFSSKAWTNAGLFNTHYPYYSFNGVWDSAGARFNTASVNSAQIIALDPNGLTLYGIVAAAAGTLVPALVRIDNSGNVGIGTTAPGRILDIQAVAASTNLASTTGTNAAYAVFNNTGGDMYVGRERSTGGLLAGGSLAYAGVWVVGGAFPAQVATNGSIRLTILSGGNVGIGTTAPGRILDIQNASASTGLTSTTGTNAVYSVFNNTGGDMYWGRDSSVGGTLVGGSSPYAGVWATGGAFPAQVATNGSIRLTILSGGNVGIGTTSPTAALHLMAGTATASTAPLKLTSGTVLTTAEAGAIEFTTDDFFATITTGAARKAFVLDNGTRLTSGKIPTATTNGRLIDGPTLGAAGLKIPAVQASARSTAQTAAVASIATFTLSASDGDVVIAANVNVTTSTLHSFSVQVDYTDETNTAQTATLTFTQLNAASVSVITNGTGAGPYEGMCVTLRCKASTAVTAKTTGTFTAVTYNVGVTMVQLA